MSKRLSNTYPQFQIYGKTLHLTEESENFLSVDFGKNNRVDRSVKGVRTSAYYKEVGKDMAISIC